MGCDHKPAPRVLLVEERGATLVEGLVAMGVLFLLITLVAQAAFLVVARNAAAGAAAGATRRAGLPGADLSRERERLLRDVTETVPGARAVDTVLTIDGTEVRSSVVFSWVPPGPDLLHLRVRVEAVGALMVPP